MGKRSGTENRRRSCQVSVRLTPEEDEILTWLSERTGGTKPQLLRDGFFTSPLADIQLDQ